MNEDTKKLGKIQSSLKPYQKKLQNAHLPIGNNERKDLTKDKVKSVRSIKKIYQRRKIGNCGGVSNTIIVSM